MPYSGPHSGPSHPKTVSLTSRLLRTALRKSSEVSSLSQDQKKRGGMCTDTQSCSVSSTPLEASGRVHRCLDCFLSLHLCSDNGVPKPNGTLFPNCSEARLYKPTKLRVGHGKKRCEESRLCPSECGLENGWVGKKRSRV